MMIPPLLLRLVIDGKNKKPVRLWLPLALIYILLLPLVALVLPLILFAGFILWVMRASRTPISLCLWLYELACAARGLKIEAISKNERVFIHVL